MIIEKQVDGNCVLHYSDAGYKLRQIETGIIFPDAVDLNPCAYTYEETDELCGDVELDDREALDIITGVAE